MISNIFSRLSKVGEVSREYVIVTEVQVNKLLLIRCIFICISYYIV